jgi:hypothetical protein
MSNIVNNAKIREQVNNDTSFEGLIKKRRTQREMGFTTNGLPANSKTEINNNSDGLKRNLNTNLQSSHEKKLLENDTKPN